MENLTATVSAVGFSDPLVVNSKQPDFKLGLFFEVSSGADITYALQFTPDDPQAEYPTDFATDATWYTSVDITGETTNQYALFEIPINAVRLNVTARVSGTATITVVQGY